MIDDTRYFQLIEQIIIQFWINLYLHKSEIMGIIISGSIITKKKSVFIIIFNSTSLKLWLITISVELLPKRSFFIIIFN